jgi:hypothetical protein
MTALTSLRERGGGWPMSMFLTPDGKPFFGGTYWPREDVKEGDDVYRGFKSIATAVQEVWEKDPKGVQKQADALAELTVQNLESGIRGIALVELDRELIKGGLEQLRDGFDKVHGGFGRASEKFRGPKFPIPSRLEFLLQQAKKTKETELLDMATLTLDQMAQGGIYDQLGGGFHRYSTERTWTVPHFEKMLYDNAQLLELYARAYQMTKKPLYAKVVRETADYLLREMMSAEGGLYSSQDAETHHEEGRSYVWTDQEIDDALGNKEDARLVRKVFGADKEPNFEKKYHIFTYRRPLEEVAKELKRPVAEVAKDVERLRKKLFEVRAKRDQPFLNKVMLTAWSGLAVAGLAEAGKALNEPRYTQAAVKAADFLLKNHRTRDGRLFRSYGAAPGQAAKAQGAGFLEDYTCLTHGLLVLHDATGDKKWLTEARALTDTMIKHHGDAKRGGYFFTAHDHEKLFARGKDQYDGPYPSGNSLALLNLVRLWVKTGEESYRKEAEKSFRLFAGSLKAYPVSLVTMLQALEVYLEVIEAKKKG